jgi:hypothetical protein
VRILIFILFIFSSIVYSQQTSDTLQQLRKHFETFQYSDVIKLSNKILQSREEYTLSEQIDILRMKAISHYSLTDDDAARKSFIEIVKLDSTYQMDVSRTSPKIITFYNETRRNYLDQYQGNQPQILVRVDTIYVPIESTIYVQNDIVTNSFYRSIILPGWGHLYSGNKTKGTLLSLVSSVAAIASAYFIIDTNNKERDYLNERGRISIERRYQDYNNSYRMRNISIASYLIVWLYSQFDLFFFNPIPNSNLIISPNEINEDVSLKITFQL